MLNVGFQLTTWFPVVVAPVSTMIGMSIAVRVCSVTAATPLTTVDPPEEYPTVLAVRESDPVVKSVTTAFVVHDLTKLGFRRVSVTVTVSNVALITVSVSGELKVGNDPDIGTFIDSPPVYGLMTSSIDVVFAACAAVAEGKKGTKAIKINVMTEFFILR